MAIDKKPVEMYGPSYPERGAKEREDDLSVALYRTEREAARLTRRFQRKEAKYSKDMATYVDDAADDFKGEVKYRPLRKKRLEIEAPGELTRKRGRFGSTQKVLKRDAEGKAYVGKFEKESWRKVEGRRVGDGPTPRRKKTIELDASGKLISKKVKRPRYDEQWELDENGTPIRTKYFNQRKRDGRFFRPISEEMSAPYEYEGSDDKFREIKRTKGSTVTIDERDKNGKLRPVRRKNWKISESYRKSKDTQTLDVTITRLPGLLGGAFSTSYESLLDLEGNEIGRNMKEVKRLWSRTSDTYSKERQLLRSEHAIGKLFRAETNYNAGVGGDGERKKIVTKYILGRKWSTDKKNWTQSEIDAEKLRSEERARHQNEHTDKTSATNPISPTSPTSMPQPGGSQQARNNVLSGSGQQSVVAAAVSHQPTRATSLLRHVQSPKSKPITNTPNALPSPPHQSPDPPAQGKQEAAVATHTSDADDIDAQLLAALSSLETPAASSASPSLRSRNSRLLSDRDSSAMKLGRTDKTNASTNPEHALDSAVAAFVGQKGTGNAAHDRSRLSKDRSCTNDQVRKPVGQPQNTSLFHLASLRTQSSDADDKDGAASSLTSYTTAGSRPEDDLHAAMMQDAAERRGYVPRDLHGR